MRGSKLDNPATESPKIIRIVAENISVKDGTSLGKKHYTHNLLRQLPTSIINLSQPIILACTSHKHEANERMILNCIVP
jgi:hypothetical protein